MTDSNTSSFDLREHARKRPGMYIGGVEARALHQLFFEALDHAIDEAVIGRCDQIWITLLPENQVVIQDNSLGLPMIYVDRENMPMMEAVLERSGIFRDPHGEYEATGSSFGAGLRAVNALSSEMRVENRHNGQLWTKTYHEGLPDGPLQQIASVPDSEHGLKLIFTPDFSILEPNPFDFERMVNRCRELTYLIAGLKIIIRDERITPFQERVCFSPDGLKRWVQDLNGSALPVHDMVHVKQTLLIPVSENQQYKCQVEFAYQFTSHSTQANMLSFVNRIETSRGGTHLAALKAGTVSAINEQLVSHGIDSQLDWQAIAHRLSAVIVLQHPFPEFDSSSKPHLMNLEVFGPIAELAFTLLWRQIEDMKGDARKRFFDHLLSHNTSNSPDSAV